MVRFSIVLCIFFSWIVGAKSFSAQPVDCEKLMLGMSNIVESKIAEVGLGIKNLEANIKSVDIRSDSDHFVADFKNVKSETVTFSIPFEFSKQKLLDQWKDGSIPFFDEAQKSNVYRKIPLPFSAVAPIQNGILDPKKLFDYASIHFVARGGALKTIGKIKIESDLTQTLSLEKHRSIFYEAEVVIPDENRDWVSVRFSDFKLNDPSLDLPLQGTPQIPNKLSLEVSAKQNRIEGTNQIEIANRFDFALDIEGHIDEFIDQLKFLPPEQGGYYFDPRRTTSGLFGRARDIIKDEKPIKNLIKKFFKNMANQKNQVFAVQTVRQGLPSVQAELAKYGWTATTVLKDKVSFLTVIGHLNEKDLFIESGKFGKLHGALTHHAQILAGIHGMSYREAKECLDFISDYIASTQNSNNWPIWTTLFDSRAGGINGSRYWRDLIYQ